MNEETVKAQDAPEIDEFMELFKLLTGPQRKAIVFMVALNAACNVVLDYVASILKKREQCGGAISQATARKE